MIDQSMKFVFQESEQGERERGISIIFIFHGKFEGNFRKGFLESFLHLRIPRHSPIFGGEEEEESDRGSGIIGSFIEVRTSW